MTGIFLKILNMSVAASWLIPAVVVLRLLLKKAPKWTRVLLWGIVAVRLVCPFSIESALSLIPSAETFPEKILSGPSFEVQTGLPAVDRSVNEYLGARYFEGVTVSANRGERVMTVLALLWILGVLALVVYAGIRYGRLRRQVATAVRLRDNLFQSEQALSPFILGVIRPRVYLPFHINEPELQYVLAHEQAHIRRKDHWWKPLGFLILAVHWLNPMVWLAYVLFCRDIELACDERVIQTLDSDQRADYAQTLVSYSANRRPVSACPLAFGEVSVKERVKSVLHYRKPAFWLVLSAILVCLTAAFCFLTNPVSDRASLEWVRTLSAEDVATAELVVFPQEESKQFKRLSDAEIARMIELLSRSDGKYQANPETLDGCSIFFYIQTADGKLHSVGNMGNVYLIVDGDAYEADYGWLSAWDDDFGAGDSPLPDGYFAQTRVAEWFDFLDNPDDMQRDGQMEVSVPEFPDATFRWRPEQIEAMTATESIPLFGGETVWNAYFYDITGDGLPEICATYSADGGKRCVVLYDYANGASYELTGSEKSSYALRRQGDRLCVEETDPGTGEARKTGRLAFQNGCVQIEYDEAED